MLGRILVLLGGLLVAVLFAALLAPLFVDWTNFRKDFEAQASLIVGQKVSVFGAVEARLLPFPSVTLHDVRVGQEADGTPLVRVARFSMDAEIAPLLSGEVRIFDMRIEEPVARLRLLQSGMLDWMRGARVEIPAKSVVLENVHITDGTVEFIDDQSGRTRHVTSLNAEMSAKSLAGPWRAEGQASIDGEAGSFTVNTSQPDEALGTMHLKTRILPATHPVSVDLDGDITFVEGRPVYSGTFSAGFVDTSAKKVDGRDVSEPRVKGGFELTNERVRIPDYRLELGATDDPYIVTGEATLDTGKAPEFLLLADGQQIDVNRLGPQGTQGKTGRDPSISARQRLDSLIEIAASIPVPQVPGRASLKLPAIVIGDTTIRDVRLDVRPAGDGWKVENAVALLPGKTQVEAKGDLQLVNQRSFTGELLVASNQPSGLSTWLSGSVDPSIRALKTAGFSAAVSLTPELQRFEGLELVIGSSVLRGRVERQAIGKDVPNLSVDLNGNEVDLDVMRGLAQMLGGADFETGLFDHRIAVQLKAAKVTSLGVSAENVETVFTIASGALSLERLTIGNLAGAALTAIGRAEGNFLAYSGTGRLTFRAFDPGPFVTMLRDRLPHHPVIDQLVRNAAWYANSDLKLTLALGGDQGQGLAVKLTGTANGSRVNLTYQLSDLADLSGNGDVKVEATLENPVTSILFGQAGLDPLPFEADENGLISLKIASSGGAPADASLTYTTNKTSFTANGAIGLAADKFLEGTMKLGLESADLEPYLIMNGISVPQLGSGLPVKFAGELAIDPAKIVLSNLSGRAADNDISGSMSIERKVPGKMTGDLAMTHASLGWLAEAIYGPVTDPSTGALSQTDLLSLPAASADVSLKVKANTFWPDVSGPVRNFAATINYKGDQLSLEDVSGDWAGGQLSGRLAMGSSSGSGFLQSRIDVANASAAAIPWLHGDRPVFTGRMGLSASIETTGKTVADLVRSASGSGQLQLTDVRVNGLNLDILKPLIAQADQLTGDLTVERIRPLAEALVDNGSTGLGGMAIPFNITDGTLRVQNVTASNDLAAISTDATIDLAAHTMNAAVALTLAPGKDAQDGSQAGLRLLYSGPMDEPSRNLDVTDVTNFLSLRAFERERRRVEKLQADVLEKQRLRREVALYKYRDAEREAQRLRALEEEKRRAEAELQQQRAAAEQAARDKAEAEAKAATEEAARVKAVEQAAQEKAAADAKAAAEEAARLKAIADQVARDKAAADAKAVAEEAARVRAAAEQANRDKAAALKVERERIAAERAAAEAARKQPAVGTPDQKGSMPVNPDEKVIRGNPLLPPSDATTLPRVE